MIAASGVPFTILSTTQFHHFVDKLILPIIESEEKVFQVPDGMSFQSVDIREVAEVLIAISQQLAAGLISNFGGSQILTFNEMFEQYLQIFSINKRGDFITLRNPRYALFRSGINLFPLNKSGKVTWKEFLLKMRVT